jgi:hypothetical protein
LKRWEKQTLKITRVKTTAYFQKELWKEFQKRCIDLEISNPEGLDQAMERWMEYSKTLLKKMPRTEGESQKKG